MEYYDENYIVIPQYQSNTSSVQISNPSIKSQSTAIPSSTTQLQYNENDYYDNYDGKEKLTASDTKKNDYSENEESEEYPQYNGRFGPPASYFEDKNKYENIENPFANPNFDFDSFLAKLSGETITPKPVEKVVPIPVSVPIFIPIPPPKVVTAPPTPKINKNKPEYYYYYDDEEEIRQEAKTPKKIYSSQIKPTGSPKPTIKPAEEEYYYEEEYDYPEANVSDKNYYRDGIKLKPIAINKTGEPIKYSSKYQGKTLKAQKPTRPVLAVPLSTKATLIPKKILASESLIPPQPHSVTIKTLTPKKILASESFIPPQSYPVTIRTTTSTTQRPAQIQKTKSTIPPTRPSREKTRQRLTDTDTTRPR